MLLKRKYEKARFPDGGTPAFIVSLEWLAKYKTYIFYNALKHGNSPTVQDDHLESNHPGKILNTPLLHHESKFLRGTGQLKEFEAEVVDSYLSNEMRERQHFEFVNEELWDFLKARYGCDQTVKRYYSVSKNSIY